MKKNNKDISDSDLLKHENFTGSQLTYSSGPSTDKKFA